MYIKNAYVFFSLKNYKTSKHKVLLCILIPRLKFVTIGRFLKIKA